ncbi:MAG: acyltransferase [Pseudorhodobacter sp.]
MTPNYHKNEQIPSLDGLRALSILIVFLSHAGMSRLIPGGFGVTVFFFLSGFLITTLMLREQAKTGKIALAAFYARRVIRLAPPILVTLFCASGLVLLGQLGGALDFATLMSQIFFYYNYFALYGPAHEIAGTGILWSLSVEEHFYLIWPALFIAISKGWIGVKHVAWMLLLILLWRFVRVFGFGSYEWAIYSATDTRFDSLLFGCLLALMNGQGQSARLFGAGKVQHLWVLGGLLLVLASFALRGEVFRSTLRYSVQGVALMPLFYYAVSAPETAYFRPLNWPWVKRIGVYSFTIYLCHYVIIEALSMQGLASGSLAMLLVAGALSVGFAALVYRFVERPLLPLRRRFAR